MKRHPFYLIEKYRTYSTYELAKKLKVHPMTIRKWSKEGLPHIENLKPWLFKGEEIKKYLQNKMQKKKIALGPEEFYCMKCRKAVKIKIESKNIKVGKNMGNYIQHIISGICVNCGCKVNKFTCSKVKKQNNTPYMQEVGKGIK